MFRSRNAIDGLYEYLPTGPLRGQDLTPLRRQAVIPAAALPCFFDPPALDPAALLQSIKQRIKRRHPEAQLSIGAVLNQLANLVAVAGTDLHQRENQQLGASLFELPV